MSSIAPSTGSGPLRVALFSGNYNYHMDGPVRALNQLVGYLERRQVPVMVFAPTRPDADVEPTGTLVSVPSVPVPGRPEYRLGLGLPRATREVLQRFRPTLVHVAAPDPSCYAAVRLANRLNVPAVASFHTRFDTYLDYYGSGWLKRTAQLYLRHFYRQCTHIYAPSQSMADIIRADDLGDDVRIWSRGIDRTTFHPQRRDMAWRRHLGIGDDEVIIAFVGRVVMEKGLDCFVAALRSLAERKVPHRVLVVGTGPAEPWLRARLPQACYTGFLRDAALSRAYASADIFFNPSRTETFGNVTAEAMASGLPCICADASGSRNLVTQGETGMLVAPGDIAGYADALAELAGNAPLRSAMSAAAAARAASLDWAAVMDSLYLNYLDAQRAHASRMSAMELRRSWYDGIATRHGA